MKIYCHYETTDQPWGGINSFFRSLKNYLIENKSNEVEVVTSTKEKFEIFLMGAASSGQGKTIEYDEIVDIVKKRKNLFFSFNKRKKFKLIHRLDGLRTIYNGVPDETDMLQVRLMELADFIIFQSKFSLDCFKQFGYNKTNYEIIYNGVNQNIFNFHNKIFYKSGKLKIISVNWSSNLRKGYQTIAGFSEVPGVESYFIGNWNKEVDPQKVIIIPPLRQKDLADYYRNADVFLHAAENDPCPNVVLEALSCGLPIIYHNSGGTAEIAGKYGLSLPSTINSESAYSLIENMKSQYEEMISRIINDKQKFSISTVADEYVNLFKRVIENES